MAAKKTAKELRDEARAKYQQALDVARKVEAREKMELGEQLYRAAEELGTEPAELLSKIKSLSVGQLPEPGTEGEADVPEKDEEQFSD
jgi:hypothetical protein